MFSKRKSRKEDSSNTAFKDHCHLDTPKTTPTASLFSVSGWVVSQAEIHRVMVGDEQMALTERADVAAIHPEFKFHRGFKGLARQDTDLLDQDLNITVHTADNVQQHSFSLDRNPLFALSKSEKLAKLEQLTSENPQQLMQASLSAEIDDANPVKLSKLRSILKCRVCGEVGLDAATDACPKGHQTAKVDEAFVYLDEEMRANHNIIPNVQPASRAQDPLAVALIGKYKDGLILDCGAGLPFQNYANVINFDIEKFANTDVIGVGEELPFADQSFDAIFSLSVLEHVKDPFLCAKEIERVLKPEGVLYVCAPLLVPVHGYPHHYYNMTQQGLANLFSEQINIVADGVPISGHPLFTLNSVANIWHSGLSDQAKREFEQTTVAELMSDPGKLVEKSFCRELSQENQALISCTNMILGQKQAT